MTAPKKIPSDYYSSSNTRPDIAIIGSEQKWSDLETVTLVMVVL